MPDRKQRADSSPSPSAASTSEPEKPPCRFLLTLSALLLAAWIVVLTVLALYR